MDCHSHYVFDDSDPGILVLAFYVIIYRLTSRRSERGWLSFGSLGSQLSVASGVQTDTMKKYIALLIVSFCIFAATAFATSYSTEATMTRQKDKGTYTVSIRVCRLVEQDGKITEQLIAQPKVISGPGVPASMYSGLQPSNSNYQKEENVSVDVSWPKVGESDFATCTVTVKLGDNVVSKSRFQVTENER